jgi:GntR family transcriptional regulator/MocR family aminotransferase
VNRIKTSTRRTADLLIHIDRRARGALQQQIYAGIRRAVLDGILGPGSRLISSRALADDLGVSRTTTLLAFEQLAAEGYIVGRRGSGTFVSEELPDDRPGSSGPRGVGLLRHPPLSRRGLALTAIPAGARRMPGPPRAFRVGVPALDLFPLRLWSQLLHRRLRSVAPTQLDYSDPAGFHPLREAIADHVQAARGTRCRADEVLIVAGAQRGLELICDLLLDVGDEAWLEDPGYPGARAALASAGARIVPVPVDDEGLSVKTGAALSRRARLAYVTPSHQFPLGAPMSLPRRLELLRWAGTARAWVIEDDYDSEFRYGTRPVPCLHGLDEDGRVIYVGSFSKTLFPALRLGFLIVPTDLMDRFLAARRASDVHPPFLDQAVLADFISGGHFGRHLRRMRGAYRERLEALTAAVDHCCGDALRIRSVRTGLHAVADVDGVDSEQVFREAASRGVEVTPLSDYFLDVGRPFQGRRRGAESPAPHTRQNGLVLGFASVRPDETRRGMDQLAAAIQAARRVSREKVLA